MKSSPSPNWLALKKKLAVAKKKVMPKEIRGENDISAQGDCVKEFTGQQHQPKLTKAVALDCEMVGIGVTCQESILARVSVVNERGDCLYDTFVKPKDYVTDLRTHVSGVRWKDIMLGKDLSVVQKEVFGLINGRIVVGHALKHDFKALLMSHPKRDVRDTSKYKPFRQVTKGRTPGLKTLARHFLGKDIQTGEHSSVEDARATMQIYRMHKREWDNSLRNAISKKKISIGKSGSVPRKLKPKIAARN